jgi:leucine dehydrogenase
MDTRAWGPLDHEEVRIQAGPRSGLPIIVAVHSTALGDAVGGCRLWAYRDWHDGLADALALSRAMTLKCAVAEVDFGGGKAVIVVPPDGPLAGTRRRDALLDFGDVVQSLGGRFHTAEDVGTTAEDMSVVRERSDWAHCLPVEHGGSGEPAELTAVGAFSAIEATWKQVTGDIALTGSKVTLIGLGQVGGRLARRLAEAGADLTVTDIDTTRRALADTLGAHWVAPQTAMTIETDMLVPAALGGALTHDAVPQLRCTAVVGPANNQLEDDGVADELAARGILWAPDFVVNAGGVIHGAVIDFGGGTQAQALTEVRRIGGRLTEIFEQADATGAIPHRVALSRASARIASGRAHRRLDGVRPDHSHHVRTEGHTIEEESTGRRSCGNCGVDRHR